MAASQTTLEPWAQRHISSSKPLAIPHVVEETDEVAVILVPSQRRRYDTQGRLVWHKIVIYKHVDGDVWTCDCDGHKYRQRLDKQGRPTCIDIDILRWYGQIKKKRKAQGVSDESIEAYRSLCASDLGEMQQTVYRALSECGPATDRELLIYMRSRDGGGWEPNTVWPRRNELAAVGLVELAGHKPQASKTRDGGERINVVCLWRCVG